MDNVSKILRDLKAEGKILFYKREANMLMSKETYGDFLIIFNTGYVLFLECKSGIHHSIGNITGKEGQVNLNQALKNSQFSNHIYIIGYNFKNPKGNESKEQYFIIDDINKVIQKDNNSVKYDDIFKNSIKKDIDLEILLRMYLSEYTSLD